MQRLHLRYVRLPDNAKDLYDELVYRSDKIIVGRGRITSEHSITFDGKLVLAAGYQIVYFDLMQKWFSVGKVKNVEGKHTGYYCDIVTPPRLMDDGGIELTDLFLDLWVSPDLRCRVLDEEELEEALSKGWITEKLYTKAKKELSRLVSLVEKKRFPPDSVKRLEDELGL